MKKILIISIFIILTIGLNRWTTSIEAQFSACSIYVPTSMSNSGLVPIQNPVSNLWGFMDSTGKVKISPSFLWVTRFNEEFAIVKKTDDEIGIIDINGNMIAPIEMEIQRARPFCNGLSAIQSTDRKWGFVNISGEIVIPPRYEKVSDFSEGRSIIQPGRETAGFKIINRKGQVIKHLVWESLLSQSDIELEHFQNGYLRVKGIPDIRFAPLINIIERRIYYGYIAHNGHVAIPFKFRSASVFSEGLARVRTVDGEKGFIDSSGEIVLSTEFKTFLGFSEGLVTARDDSGKFGYMDMIGNMIIPAQYLQTSQFSDDFAAVKLGEKWGYIDKLGNLKIDSIFDFAGYFDNGISSVRIGENKFFINKKGEEIVPKY